MGKNILSSEIINDISKENIYYPVLKLSGMHTLSYFIADTLDILIYYRNEPRKTRYLLHHLFSIISLSTLYWNSYLTVYGSWTLELGSIVHHLKYASKYLNFNKGSKIIVEILYHVVYVITRILLFQNINVYVLNNYNNLDFVSGINILAGYGLIIQNGIWWMKNVKSLCYDK